MRTLSLTFGILALMLFGTSIASAHVTVKPNKVTASTFQTFSVSVPNEKDLATTQVRLVIPEGLSFVTPTVKPGWSISLKKEGEGETAKVTEITWSNGTIPAEQRDEFSFSAKTPAGATSLIWKAYQSYADGTLVSWDQAPNSGAEEGTPYSETAVSAEEATSSPSDSTARNLAAAALGVAILALVLPFALRK